MNKFTKKVGILAGVLGLSLSLASGMAAADTIVFDPTGTAGAGGNINIDVLDQAPGNALAIGASALSTVGTNFNLLYQANLQAAQLGSSPVFTQGDGGRSFTFVAGFGETILASTPVLGGAGAGGLTTLNFGFNAASTTNFFYMYANTAGNNLTGTGFVGAAADRILVGHIVGSGFTSTFTADGQNGPVPLDDNGTNNYAGVNTIEGAGSTRLRVVIDSFDANYFPSMVLGATIELFNSSNILAYSQIDPSACFSSNGTVGCDQGGVSTVGVLNQVTGPNTMFQADANSSFKVPEPASVLLLGLGLLGLGLSRRKIS